MTTTLIALTALCLQQGLFTLLWLVVAALRMARRATLHWASGLMVITSGLGLVVLREGTPRWLGYWASVVALYAGFVIIKRGLNVFFRQATHDLPHLLGLLATALVVAVATWLPGPAWLFVTTASVPVGLLLFTMARVLLNGMRVELGPRFAQACALPFWLMGCIVMLRALLAPVLPHSIGASMHGTGGANLGAAFSFMAMGLLLNFVLVAAVCGRMVRRLERASDYDGLTTLLNRRAIEKRLHAQALRLQRDGRPYSLLSIDLDHFKRINDRHGHPVGDAVLRQFGHTLAEHVRVGDLPARAGGEEFWVLLPDTDLPGARALAERVQQAVREVRVPVRDGHIEITVSMGLVVASQRGEDLALLMQRLDAALYRAKDAGRNCIEVAEAPGVAPGTAPRSSAALAAAQATAAAAARREAVSAGAPAASPGGPAP